jgi:hypothetical protein
MYRPITYLYCSLQGSLPRHPYVYSNNCGSRHSHHAACGNRTNGRLRCIKLPCCRTFAVACGPSEATLTCDTNRPFVCHGVASLHRSPHSHAAPTRTCSHRVPDPAGNTPRLGGRKVRLPRRYTGSGDRDSFHADVYSPGVEWRLCTHRANARRGLPTS